MTLASLIALAVVDSINPSAIVVTLALLMRPGPGRAVPVYVAAIFATYFAIGAATLLGLASVWPQLGPALEGPAGFVLQGLIGAALFVWSMRSAHDGPPSPASTLPSTGTYLALAALGVTVTMLELPTALPYLGALAILTAADLPASRWVPLLAGYNAIFVTPPLLLLAAHLALGDRVAARYAGLRARLERGAHDGAKGIAGVVGGGLALWSAIELLARLR
jgi:cytochrome c biogenesis protein CcdA